MSRTIRRKNGWKVKSYTEVRCYCHNGECDFDRNQKRGCYHWANKRYHGCTKEQVEARLKAWYYSDSPQNFGDGFATKFARWKLRVTNKNELVKALKRGEEEDLLLTPTRALRGLWWYYD